MKHTKKNRETASVPFSVVDKQNEGALKACFAQNSQMLLPLLDLVQNTRTSINELMHDAGRSLIEQLLVLSEMEVAGDKHPGRAAGDVRWHGSQQGRVVMDARGTHYACQRAGARPGRRACASGAGGHGPDGQGSLPRCTV